eukprot:8374977-Karenia_brevis.AAC.1
MVAMMMMMVIMMTMIVMIAMVMMMMMMIIMTIRGNFGSRPKPYGLKCPLKMRTCVAMPTKKQHKNMLYQAIPQGSMHPYPLQPKAMAVGDGRVLSHGN